MWYSRFRQAIGCAVAAHLVFLAPGAAVAQSAADFESAISLAKGFATGGRAKDAVVEAQKAIRMNPTRFEGYFVAAMALLRQEMPADADKYAQDALRLVPPDRRKEVEQLATTIKRQLLALQKEEQAEDARAAGQIYLAATLYLDAFELNPLRADLGLVGARLWLMLRERGRAARIYRRLAVGADASAKAEGLRQLSNLASALADEWSTNTTNGWRHLDNAFKVRPPAQAILEVAVEAFERAIDAWPDAAGPSGTPIGPPDSPYVGLAAAHAAQGNRRSFEAALTRGAQNGLRPDTAAFFAANPQSCAIGCRRYDALASQVCQADFTPFLHAAYGPPAVRAVNAACGTGRAYADRLMMEEAQDDTRGQEQVKSPTARKHARKHRRRSPAY